MLFRPPPAFRNDMLAAREDWAPGADKKTQLSIANAIANTVFPRIVDLCLWRDHAADFFVRLCSHRQRLGSSTAEAMEQLRTAHYHLEERVRKLEAGHANLQAPPQDGQGSDPQALAQVRNAGPARGRSVPDRVFNAQLAAIRARSHSPGPDLAIATLEHRDRLPSRR